MAAEAATIDKVQQAHVLRKGQSRNEWPVELILLHLLFGGLSTAAACAAVT
jgi:hypothetical protein